MSKCKLFVDVEDRKDSNPLKQNQEKMISTTSRNFPFKSSSKNNVRQQAKCDKYYNGILEKAKKD